MLSSLQSEQVMFNLDVSDGISIIMELFSGVIVFVSDLFNAIDISGSLFVSNF